MEESKEETPYDVVEGGRRREGWHKKLLGRVDVDLRKEQEGERRKGRKGGNGRLERRSSPSGGRVQKGRERKRERERKGEGVLLPWRLTTRGRIWVRGGSKGVESPDQLDEMKRETR